MEVDAVEAGEVLLGEVGDAEGEEEVDVAAEAGEPVPVGLEEQEDGACCGGEGGCDCEGLPETRPCQVEQDDGGEGGFDAEGEGEEDGGCTLRGGWE